MNSFQERAMEKGEEGGEIFATSRRLAIFLNERLGTNRQKAVTARQRRELAP